MGEIAEMMLDGTLCEGCGEFMGEALGYPVLCAGCAKDRKRDGHEVEKNIGNAYIDLGKNPKPRKRQPCEVRPKVSCEVCKKRVNVVGIKDHMRDVHGVK